MIKICIAAADECAAGQFRCDDGSCISQLHVCNGEYECPDGSDESENKTCSKSSTIFFSLDRCAKFKKKITGKIL